MTAGKQNISDVLSMNQTSFFIPPFQRSYAWGKEQLERYFDDIKRIIKSEQSDDKDKLQHFFGSLVIKNEEKGFSKISNIVDGQQRLTTTLIFLIALRDTLANDDEKAYIQNNYLCNQNSDFDDKIKLKQVSKDWNSYKALVNNDKNKSLGIIKNAYNTFVKLIESFPQAKINDYITAIKRLNVAVIFLDERAFMGEDPQIIFETLNSLGKPLTLSDLVRNYVLLKMDSNRQSQIYENEWFPKIEQELGENTSNFFRDFLQLKKASSVKTISDSNTKEIYADLKSFVLENYKNSDNNEDFIKDIISYAPLYKLIIDETNTQKISDNQAKNNEIKELLRNIFQDITSDVFKSFMLGILDYHSKRKFSDDDLIDSLKAIRTYLIRRRILKLSASENKSVPILAKRLDDLASGDTNMYELLSNQPYNSRFPNDDEVIKALKEANFYVDYKKHAKFILGKIEEHNSKVPVPFRDEKITIEHIMPQTLNSVWNQMLGDFAATSKEYLHNIGNLILTEFNGEMSNKSFEEKKKKLEMSNLNYRIEILGLSKWGKDEIENHQRKMINDFLVTFSLPEKYKNAFNYAISEDKEAQILSPLDDDARIIAEGRKPTNIIINGKETKVADWQDVLIQFLRFIKDDENFGLEIVLDNQNEILGRVDAIISSSELKAKITEEPQWDNRYKSFDGLTINKIIEPRKDELFIHTNISAVSCIKRIANVMNKFNMSDDFIQIKIKEQKRKK